MILPKDVHLSSAEMVLTQDEDSDGRAGHEYQVLTIKLADAGGGPYPVLETERWAINPDEIDAFADIIKTFLAACSPANDK